MNSNFKNNKNLKRVALVAAVACTGNLAYAYANPVEANALGCGGGCASTGACADGCGCFPNPFEPDGPGSCVN